MKIRKQILAGALASCMVGLAACSGGGEGTQDVGNNDPAATSRTFNARAIDGYLAGATVYVDQNGNNRLDAFEPRALTDTDGYFSHNHSTGTDYCATGGLAQHCLRGAIDVGAEVLIRVTGGYDTITQLPFKGVLSLRSSELDRDDLRLVTPATSMVADSSSDAAAKFQMLIDAGILQANGSLDDDPMNGVEVTRAQFAAIMARLVGEAGNVSYPATFQDVQSDAWAASYVAMATKLLDVGQSDFATFGSTFSSVQNVEELARGVIYSALNAGQLMPADFVLPNAAQLVSLFQSTAGFVGLNEEMIAALNGAAPTPEELKAMLRLQAVAAERLLANPTDPELPDLTDWVRNQLAQGSGLGSDLTALGGEDIDLSALTATDFDFDPASNSISASAKIPAAAASTFAALVNTSFGIGVQEPDEQGAAVFFVSGSNGGRSGDIDVCVRYRGDDEDFDTTSSGDPNGAMLIGGRWSLLDDHTLTLNIEVVGGVRSLLLKAVDANGSDRDYRFDFGQDLSQWSGTAPAGFATGAVPSSDAACKAALIEKFGPMT